MLMKGSVTDRYLDRTRNSKRLFERATRIFPGGFTRTPFVHGPYPTFIAQADGCRMWDVDGNEYIDYVNN